MITPNFSRAEMSCRCGCGLDYMDEQFMKMLQQLGNQLGPLPVTSGVRCEKHNHESGGYPKSAHLQSKGADILIFGLRALQLVEEARRIGFSGLGISQKGDKSSRSFIWIYYPEPRYGVIEPSWTGRTVSPSEGLLSPIHLSK